MGRGQKSSRRQGLSGEESVYCRITAYPQPCWLKATTKCIIFHYSAGQELGRDGLGSSSPFGVSSSHTLGCNQLALGLAGPGRPGRLHSHVYTSGLLLLVTRLFLRTSPLSLSLSLPHHVANLASSWRGGLRVVRFVTQQLAIREGESHRASSRLGPELAWRHFCHILLVKAS